MISSDRNMLVPGSAVSERMKEYGALVDELHIVLLSTSSHGHTETKLAKNVTVYPTKSLTRWFYPMDAARIGKKVVFEKKFVRGRSVITVQDPFECGKAGLSIKKKWRLPFQVQLHTDPFSPYFNGFLNTVRKRIAKRVMRNADAVRCVNPVLAQKVAEGFSVDSRKIEVLPIYIDRTRIEDKKLTFDLHATYPWRFVLLAVARLVPEKDLSLALIALREVRKRFPDTGLVIAGDGPERKKLEKQVKEFKLSQHVAFVGWQEELISYYRTANSFIQTSVFEGYGLALVEAGLAGLPVITTPVGIASELVDGKDALICLPGDAACFTRAIEDLIENNHIRESLRISMKHALDEKLLSKEEYLKRIKQGWENAAQKIKA